MASWIKRFITMALLACGLVAAGQANAAVQITLKLSDIRGESIVSRHEGEIDVLGYNWSVGAQGVAVRPGAGGGKASANALIISKYVDAASPLLFQSAIQGKRIAEATLVLIKVGGRGPVDVVKIKLKDVIVTSVKTGTPAPGGDRFTEEISLAFAAAEYSYVRQNPDGSAGAAVTVSW